MSTGVKNTVLVFGLAHILTVCIFFSITIFNVIYIYPVASGDSANLLYTFAWWGIFVFVIINYIYPLLLLTIIVDEQNQSRVDIHSIVTTLYLCINFIVLIGCTVTYFLYSNTSYSGNFPFNDPRWCCSFYIEAPTLCPNTVPCLPVANPPLYQGYELIVIWIFSGVFIILGFIHLGLNRLLRISGCISPPSPAEGRLMGIVVSVIYAGLFSYFIAWPLFDLQYLNGYPTLSIPPGPGTFVSTLYGWQWVLVCITVLVNCVPPVVSLACFISEVKSYSITSFHYWTNLICGIVTGAMWLIFIGIWLFDCNWWWWDSESICRSDLWCCVYFATNYNICGNVTPCNAILRANDQFVQLVVFSGIFSCLAFVLVWLNLRMIKYGLFQ
jgi:hypothetical protein